MRNNGGGHANHSLFWQIMKPGGGGEPTGKLAEAIKKDLGGFAAFKKQFNEAARSSSAPAGPGSSGKAASSPSPPPPTRTAP